LIELGLDFVGWGLGGGFLVSFFLTPEKEYYTLPLHNVVY